MNEFDEINETIRPKFSEMDIRETLSRTLGTTNYDFMVDIIMEKLHEVYYIRNFSHKHDEVIK